MAPRSFLRRQRLAADPERYRQIRPLTGLERLTVWGGRDTIDYGPEGMMTSRNAVAGSLVTANRLPAFTVRGDVVRRDIVWRDIVRGGGPT
jgi:hypothetical protein